MKKRVFIAFDYDHDRFLKVALVGQARLPDSPFDLIDWSVKAPYPGDWTVPVRARIRAADLVIVICGEHTHTAVGVDTEMKIAAEERIPYFLLWGYDGKPCTRPRSASSSEKIYKWDWPNLKSLIGGVR